MKPFFLALFSFLSIVMTAAEIPVEKFVNIVRTPPGRDSWGQLSGTVVHRRKGEAGKTSPIRFSVLFANRHTLAQIWFQEKGCYRVIQNYEPPFESNVETEGNPGLTEFGVRPEDLTMNFIFWPFKRELSPDTVRGRNCRVLFLESPDKKEAVKVYVSTEYYFPLRVEWMLDGDPDKKPFRTLETTAFKKSGDLWIVTGLSVYGPGWRTTVEFTKTNAGLSSSTAPKDLFQ